MSYLQLLVNFMFCCELLCHSVVVVVLLSNLLKCIAWAYRVTTYAKSISCHILFYFVAFAFLQNEILIDFIILIDPKMLFFIMLYHNRLNADLLTFKQPGDLLVGAWTIQNLWYPISKSGFQMPMLDIQVLSILII